MNQIPDISFFMRTLAGVCLFCMVLSGGGCKEVPDEEVDKKVVVVRPFGEADADQVEEVLNAMTLEEKIGQLVLLNQPGAETAERVTLFGHAAKGRIGGYMFSDLTAQEFIYLTDSLKRLSAIPPFIGTEERVSLHNQFSGLVRFPDPVTIQAIDSAGIHRVLEQHYIDQCRALGINLSFKPVFFNPDQPARLEAPASVEAERVDAAGRFARQQLQLSSHRILSVAGGFQPSGFPVNDSLREVRLQNFLPHCRAGLTGLFISPALFGQGSIPGLETTSLSKYLAGYMDFHGLVVTEVSEDDEKLLRQFAAGAHLFITDDVERFHRVISGFVQNSGPGATLLDDRVRDLLKAKSWIHKGRLPVELTVFPRDSMRRPVQLVSLSGKKEPRLKSTYAPRPEDLDILVEEVRCYFEEPAWELFTTMLYERSVVLASNVNKLLPVRSILDHTFRIYQPAGRKFRQFHDYFAKYADFEVIGYDTLTTDFPVEVIPRNLISVVLLDNTSIPEGKDSVFYQSVNELSRGTDIVVVNFGDPANLRFFDPGITFLQVFERNDVTESFAAQAIFGGVGVGGKLPVTVNRELSFAVSEPIYPVRVRYGTPEITGIARERLVGIDAIVETAIDKRVFPGCQVTLAKNGTVIYTKSFGYHTYSKKREVQTTDLYDIASVTKVAATTPALMKLYDNNRLDISARIGDYVYLDWGSAVRNIRVKHLLTHYSGLQAPMPIRRFFNYRNVPSNGCNEIFCKHPEEGYDVRVARDLYFRQDFQDTIWHRVANLSVASPRRFRYSDVNFFLLQKLVEDQTSRPLDQYVEEVFYHPLGLRHLIFNPQKKFGLPEIVPTEKDYRWRKGLIHGHVHDPAAALMGGVGGNAGVFSNAEDLTVFFQMLLNDGVYGGIQYFQSSTIEEFTSNKYSNRRGLGFDKPIQRKYPTYSRKTDPGAYGHTGFTGTCVWVDPANDLVYVFLSNRVHPSTSNKKLFTENTRARIHEVVYNAFDSFEGTLPELNVD